MKELRIVFEEKYPQRMVVLDYFEQANNCYAVWANMTKLKLISFISYMENRCSKNSARYYASILKAVLNMYSDEDVIPCKDFKKILTVRKEVTANMFLSISDLKKIEALENLTESQNLIRCQFLIGCYTGARHSDCIKITAENVINNTLSYVSQKTKIQATVPVRPSILEMIEYVKDKPDVSDCFFNRTIRKICEKAGIKEKVKVFVGGKEKTGYKYSFVSSHTARRSFASNLYLLGADVYAISAMMGHASVKQTEGYICVQLKELPEKAMEYFR